MLEVTSRNTECAHVNLDYSRIPAVALHCGSQQPRRPSFIEHVKSHFRGSERRLIEEVEYMRGRFLPQLLLIKRENCGLQLQYDRCSHF